MHLCCKGFTSILILFAGLSLSAGDLLAQDLRLLLGDREIFIESRENQGKTYYRLNRIAEVFSLELTEKGPSLLITSDRGRLELTEGRPLVRSSDEYLLLSSAVWKRRAGDWFVPVDFIQKALPSILNYSISYEGPGRYRVRGLEENRIRVRTVALSNRLSVIFDLSDATEKQVRDLRDFIEVTFEEKLVIPSILNQSPEKRVISSLTFDPQIGLGTFRIEKGNQYSHFREQRRPKRLVIDIYPKTGFRISSAETTSARPPILEPGAPFPGPDSSDRTFEDFTRPSGMVVIDPGHGGQDRGVNIQLADAAEKTLTLQISRELESELNRLGIPSRLTRYRDVNLGIEQRSAIANYYRAKVYLSIHMGASPSIETRGPISYVYTPVPPEESEEESPSSEEKEVQDGDSLVPWDRGQEGNFSESRRLARRIQAELNSLFGTRNSTIAVPLEVLAAIRGPAILIELGQLSNPEDRELLADPEFVSKIVNTISGEIARFIP